MEKGKIAVIGSCVCDVIMKVAHLPKTAQDVNLISQSMALGGCAYNVAHVLHELNLPYVLFSPIGSGIYGDFVRTKLREQHMKSILDDVKAENGCCYCLVEPHGERTFLSLHGAEYRFQKDWFSHLDTYPLNSVYVCGLEIEEDSGKHIIQWLKTHPNLQIYFAPGPRICKLNKEHMEALFQLHAILHVNEEEALAYTKKATIEEAAASLYSLSQACVIITLGAKGCYFYDGKKAMRIPQTPVKVVDTIGAGDTHIGTIIASRHLQLDWQTSLTLANQLAAYVVQHAGATLTKEDIAKLKLT